MINNQKSVNLSTNKPKASDASASPASKAAVPKAGLQKKNGAPNKAASATQAARAAEKSGTDDSKLKNKLFLQVGLAALMIVVLLGAIFWYDPMNAEAKDGKSEEVVPAVMPEAKPSLTPLSPALPLTPPAVVDASSEAADSAKKESVPELTAAPMDKSIPPPPDVAARPKLPQARSARSAASSEKDESRQNVQPTVSARPTPKVSEWTYPNAPLTPPKLFSGYGLQAGVFSDMRRAEELHAKLMIEGVPATLETRVQVGPFKTKAEAEAVRLKLQKLGIGTVLLPKAEAPKPKASKPKAPASKRRTRSNPKP